jgi:RHH-type rel operon transcriptional repressor/antitoxin RelB
MIALRLPEKVEKRLNALAKKTGRTKTFYVREAILNHLDDLEDTWLALRRLEKPGRIWTMKEVEQEIDLAD